MTLSIAICGTLQAAEAANPNINPRTQAVLDYFHTVCTNPDHRVLSGQFTGYGRRGGLAIIERIHERTGKRPALLGTDYVEPLRGDIQWKEANQTAVAYWRQGGLVTISAHLPSPANPAGRGLRDRDVNLDDLLQAGTDAHWRWIEQLDQVAAGLAELRDAGVVVLWRPLHEMNGDWFWWSGKDPDAFIRIWRHMFEYFSVTKGLDNLLWVYSPNHGDNTASYYPGDRFVDVVGLDAYTDHIDYDNILGYPEVAALSKPFGFTEYGPHDAHDPPGNYDYRRLLDGVVRHFPRACFFVSWYDRWSLARNAFVRELLSDPRMVNRDDLPSFADRAAGDAAIAPARQPDVAAPAATEYRSMK